MESALLTILERHAASAAAAVNQLEGKLTEVSSALAWVQKRSVEAAKDGSECVLKMPRRILALREALAEEAEAARKCGIDRGLLPALDRLGEAFTAAVRECALTTATLPSMHTSPSKSPPSETSRAFSPTLLHLLGSTHAISAALGVALGIQRDLDAYCDPDALASRVAGLEAEADADSPISINTAFGIFQEWYRVQWVSSARMRKFMSTLTGLRLLCVHQIRAQYVKLAQAVSKLVVMRPYFPLLQAPIAARDDLLRRLRRAGSFVEAAAAVTPRAGSSATNSNTIHDVDDDGKGDERSPEEIADAVDAQAVELHLELRALILPALAELQVSALAQAQSLKSRGKRADAVAACRPFLELFRVAHVLLVAPHSQGPTVVPKAL